MHLARTVVRRLERGLVHLVDEEGEGAVRPLVLVVNRLSDWFFVMGRWVSMMLNEEEALWVPLGSDRQRRASLIVLTKRANDGDFDSL